MNTEVNISASWSGIRSNWWKLDIFYNCLRHQVSGENHSRSVQRSVGAWSGVEICLRVGQTERTSFVANRTVRHHMYHNSSSEMVRLGTMVKPERNRCSKHREGNLSGLVLWTFMKYLQRNFFAKAWIWKVDRKVRFRGKAVWVKALNGSEWFMAIIGMVVMEEMRTGLFMDGWVRKSGIRFLSTLMCWTVKSYFVNHVFKLSNCLSGSNLFLKSKIFGKELLSILMRKLWLTRWNSNFLIP